MKFRTYKRRSTTRESGFHVSGETTGSQCKIFATSYFSDNSKSVTFLFRKDKLNLVNIFGLNQSMLATGFYLFPENELNLTAKIKFVYEKQTHEKIHEIKLGIEQWNKIGIHEFIDIETSKIVEDIEITLTFGSLSKKIQFYIYGFDFDIISKLHYIDNKEAWDEFSKKTSITVPETYYLNHELPIEKYLVKPTDKFKKGKPLVLKSCNRCARYLPINIDDERITLAFSNHCVSRAPCSHRAFSKYQIIGPKNADLKQINADGQVESYFGHQLECKACKKFFVNAPLNPMRTSTQHREDSLRRRAIEVLVDTLLDNEWIYHKFRKNEKKEFDKHIWEQFNKQCFMCNKKITVNEMDLDHTMPLAYLWALDNTATCLCSSCNSKKSDSFPVDFYDKSKLKELSEITGLSLSILGGKSINQEAIKKLIERIDWFFDDFLMHKNYQKIRDGKKTADQIFNSIQKVINISNLEFNLIGLYSQKTGKTPQSISIKKS